MYKNLKLFTYVSITSCFVLYFIFYKYFNENNAIIDAIRLSKWLLMEEELPPSPEFRLNPEYSICEPEQGKSLLFIVFVILAPHHFDKRNLVRETWGNKSLSSDFKLIFTIGMSTEHTVNQKIADEFVLHNDILQLTNFNDSYFNMTTKIMKSFKWISEYCSNAFYVLRINDDVVVNTFQLISHFRGLSYKKNQIFGFRIYGVGPVRWKDSKFYVSEKDYNKSYYDDYIEGLIFFILYFDWNSIQIFASN